MSRLSMREHPSDRVDVRSDTITQPTAAMRAVMESAVEMLSMTVVESVIMIHQMIISCVLDAPMLMQTILMKMQFFMMVLVCIQIISS